MKLIVRQGVMLVVCVTVIYGFLLAISLALVPRPSAERALDMANVAQTIFMTEPKYIYLNRGPLRSDTQKVVVVGASNVVVGFTQPELTDLLPPQVVVHNLGIGGANMTEVRQVIDLVQQVQNPEVRRREIFVIGIWYGMFNENRVRWNSPDRHPGDTDIDIERYRYGFERRTAGGPVAIVPWRYLGTATTAIYPLLVIDKLSRDVVGWLNPEDVPGQQELDAATVSDAQRDKLLNYWSKAMGIGAPPLPDEQFEVLRDACNTLLDEGSRLILVDLPLPRWHQRRSPYDADYEARKARIVDQLIGRPGFTAVSLRDLDENADYYDEVHPKPRARVRWSRRLAAEITPLLRSAGSMAGTAAAPPRTGGQMR